MIEYQNSSLFLSIYNIKVEDENEANLVIQKYI